ncbi:hypothetical protein NDU88_002421 [Pleurodeles waltl]|uniref:Gag protein n=1 Tax=Pleurodeles waltl TaxID=8319 RepID=A0AAV7W0L9_PLEWA|nr:hypothetical protein NDU88_002421 [Pleurodeles waltl]
MAEIHKIAQSLVEAGQPHTYNTLNQTLTMHFEPLANPDYVKFLLRPARQHQDEPVDAFYACLKELASSCTLPDAKDEIGVQFIQGFSSTKLRKNILQVSGMSMANILTLGCSKELSKVRAADMEAALQQPIKTEPFMPLPPPRKNGRKSAQKQTPPQKHATGVGAPTLTKDPVQYKERGVKRATRLITLERSASPQLANPDQRPELPKHTRQ